MKVANIDAFTRAIADLFEETPGYLNAISRVVPAHVSFDYQSAEESLETGEEAILGWSERLADESFYIRMHRRDFKGQIVSPEAERALDEALLDRLKERGHPGCIDFESPDFVIDIETVGNRAGFSIGTSQELARFSFLHTD